MKKLALYSDQIPSISDAIDNELIALIGKPEPVIGYIPSNAAPQRKYYQERQAYYSRMGMDLRVYFELDSEYHPEMLESLLSCDGIHLSRTACSPAYNSLPLVIPGALLGLPLNIPNGV